MSKLKIESILTAIFIYLILIVSIFFSAFYEPSIPKAKNYVEQKSKIIEVSLGSPLVTKNINKSNKQPKKEHKKSKQKKVKRPKKIRNTKVKHKTKPKKVVKSHKKSKVIHKKVAKKSSSKPAKQDIKKLFSKISSQNNSSSSSGAKGKSIKKVNKGQGVVNRYFAKVQKMLQGWPAQNNFAGEKVRVELTIYSSGLFDYKILHHSLNPEFNRALKNYLEQLKRLGGFGPHSNPKPYKIVVEFIAKG